MSSTTLESKPVHVVLAIKGHLKNGVFCDIPNQEECQWDDTLKDIIDKTYSDMKITVGDLHDNVLEFDAWFVNRVTREDDVYSKLNHMFYLNKSIIPESLAVSRAN